MAETYLTSAVADVPALRAVLVTAMPDCLLYECWLKEGTTWAVEDLASYFGDLVRANRQALKTLGSWSSDMQVTIESADSLVVLREVTADFVCGFVFDHGTPLGMIRLHLRRLLERIAATLPQVTAEQRPRGVRVIEFLQRYAPDPHAVLLRVGLRTGLGLDVLQRAESLNQFQIQQLETAAREILGLRELNV